MKEKVIKTVQVTLSGLVDFLNENYGSKKTSEPFNINDAKSYTTRGVLPKYLCDATITKVTEPGMDRRIKLYNVEITKETGWYNKPAV